MCGPTRRGSWSRLPGCWPAERSARKTVSATENFADLPLPRGAGVLLQARGELGGRAAGGADHVDLIRALPGGGGDEPCKGDEEAVGGPRRFQVPDAL